MRSFLCWYLMIYLDVLLELPVFKLQPWDSRTTERFWNPMDKLWNEAPCERSLIINLQWISLTHEQLHFHHGSVRGVICDLINVLGSLSVILQRVSYCHRTLSVKCIVVSLSRTCPPDQTCPCNLLLVPVLQPIQTTCQKCYEKLGMQ